MIQNSSLNHVCGSVCVCKWIIFKPVLIKVGDTTKCRVGIFLGAVKFNY